MVPFACSMSHPSIRHKLGNLVIPSKTCPTGNDHPQKHSALTWARGAPVLCFLLEFLNWVFLFIPLSLTPLFLGLGIICMTAHSGPPSAWSPLRLWFGTWPSFPPSCVSASSSFSWWPSISSIASSACSAASVRNAR